MVDQKANVMQTMAEKKRKLKSVRVWENDKFYCDGLKVVEVKAILYEFSVIGKLVQNYSGFQFQNQCNYSVQ